MLLYGIVREGDVAALRAKAEAARDEGNFFDAAFAYANMARNYEETGDIQAATTARRSAAYAFRDCARG